MSSSLPPSSPAPGRPGDLPTWLAALIVLACVGGGAALAWWYFTSPPKVVTVALPPQRQRAAQQQVAQPPQQDWNDDVRVVNNGFNARAGNVQLIARRREGAGAYNLNVVYRSELIPGSQLLLMRALVMANRPEQAEALKLSPEQIGQLKRIQRQRGMLLTPEDRQQLQAAFDAFEKAAPDQRQEPKAKLLALLSSLDTKNRAPTKAAIAANIAAVRAVLTAEQQGMIERNEVPR